jgi:stress-induced morphogen
MKDRENRIKEALNQAFDPEIVEITDDSHLHVGHAGARDGRGHFTVLIVSDKFRDQSRLARHRLVYEALDSLLKTDIHALRIKAYARDEI